VSGECAPLSIGELGLLELSHASRAGSLGPTATLTTLLFRSLNASVGRDGNALPQSSSSSALS
jgi:hypothetical protein